MNEIYLGNDPGSPPESICDRCDRWLSGECDCKPCAPHPEWCEDYLDANGKEAESTTSRTRHFTKPKENDIMQDNEWTKICAACAEGTPPERCAYYGEPGGCNAPKLGQHPDGNVAERLQEELEKAERRIAELERAPGNVAAMRAVVERCRDYFADLLTLISPEDENRLLNECNAALAAPARNCDRFATAEDAWMAFKRKNADAYFDTPSLNRFKDWLFAPAEGGVS